MNEHDATELSYQKGFNDAMTIVLNKIRCDTASYEESYKVAKNSTDDSSINLILKSDLFARILTCYSLESCINKLLKQEEHNNE